MTLTITVRGIPAPQGSKRYLGRGVMVESSAKVKPWRDAVRSDAITAMNGLALRLDCPIMAEMRFYFARPRSHYRTGRNAHLLRNGAPIAPAGTPDLSKLIRATEDALTDAGVWADDARVVQLKAAKYYTNSVNPAPGAVIVLYEMSLS